MSQQPDGSEQMDLAEVRWASRVNPSTIRRLYEADAHGIVDEELVDEVGFALYARCQSILRVTGAQHGQVTCPRCEAIVARKGAGPWDQPDEVIICSQCGWSVRWRDYLRSYQNKHLVGGGATAMHEAYVEQFANARSPREKMLAIDRLIHAFHWELVSDPGRPAARELIYARNTTELLTFLDRLTYGEGSTPGLRESKAQWKHKVTASPWLRRTGFHPEGWPEPDSQKARH